MTRGGTPSPPNRPRKRIPPALLHVIGMLPRLLEAGGPYLLFSEAEDELRLLGAVFGPSEVLGVDAKVLFAKLGGVTGPHLSPIHVVPLAKLLSHTAPTLAVPFLASFEALRERKGPSGTLRGKTRDQTAPEGAHLLCRALRSTTEIPHVAANGLVFKNKLFGVVCERGNAITRALRKSPSILISMRNRR